MRQKSWFWLVWNLLLKSFVTKIILKLWKLITPLESSILSFLLKDRDYKLLDKNNTPSKLVIISKKNKNWIYILN
jgi:hypothetical protein